MTVELRRLKLLEKLKRRLGLAKLEGADLRDARLKVLT